MKFSLEAACAFSIGKTRDDNEDNFYFGKEIRASERIECIEPIYQHFTVDPTCFAVFDGMGGQADGQVAAYLAADALRNDVRQIEQTGMLSENFFDTVIARMNSVVSMEAARMKNNMGTTAVIAGFCNGTIYLCNVGDSRAYRFRKGSLVQISKDHVQCIPPFRQQAGKKATLSQYIGIPPEDLMLEPFLMTGAVEDGDMYLLCTDGLTDMLSSGEISFVFDKETDVRECAQQLVKQAYDHGGKDNITVIIVRAEKYIEKR